MPFTTDDKLKAIKKEINWRRYVYPNRIRAGKMTEEQADRNIALMEAIQADYEEKLTPEEHEVCQEEAIKIALDMADKIPDGVLTPAMALRTAAIVSELMIEAIANDKNAPKDGLKFIQREYMRHMSHEMAMARVRYLKLGEGGVLAGLKPAGNS